MNSYNGKWPGGPEENFNDVCFQLAKDISSFKQHSSFTHVIGNDTRSELISKELYEFIKNNNPVLLQEKYLNKFIENDRIGQPRIYKIDNINISPGTLIFMRHLYDIINNFSGIKSIIEIGSGYGGQCKVIKDYLDVDYTCVDIPGCLELCKVYLNRLNVDATFISNRDVPKLSADLVISNYCLNELNETGVDFYFDSIIKNASNLYISAGNFNLELPRSQHLLNRCNELFNITIHNEIPKVSKHNNIFIVGKKRI